MPHDSVRSTAVGTRVPAQSTDTTIEFGAHPVEVTDVEDASIGASILRLSVSPQPADDIVSFTYSKGPQGGLMVGSSALVTLRIFDITGSMVLDLSDRLVSDEGVLCVSVQQLPRGMYMLQLSVSARVLVIPVVIQ